MHHLRRIWPGTPRLLYPQTTRALPEARSARNGNGGQGLRQPPLGQALVARPLQRPPKREVHAAWRRSASPAIQAALAELNLLST